MNSDRFEGAAKDVGGKVQQAFGMATGDAQMRAEGVAREVAGKGQNLYGQAADGLRETADRAADLADQAYDRGSRYVQQNARAVEQQVTQYPLAGVLLAGAVGFLLGVTMSSSRR